MMMISGIENGSRATCFLVIVVWCTHVDKKETLYQQNTNALSGSHQLLHIYAGIVSYPSCDLFGGSLRRIYSTSAEGIISAPL